VQTKRNEFKKLFNSQLFLAGGFVSGEQSTVSMSIELDSMSSFGNHVHNEPANGLFVHPKLSFVDANNNEPCVILPTQFLIECVFLIFLDFGGLTLLSFSILF